MRYRECVRAVPIICQRSGMCGMRAAPQYSGVQHAAAPICRRNSAQIRVLHTLHYLGPTAVPVNTAYYLSHM